MNKIRIHNITLMYIILICIQETLYTFPKLEIRYGDGIELENSRNYNYQFTQMSSEYLWLVHEQIEIYERQFLDTAYERYPANICIV